MRKNLTEKQKGYAENIGKGIAKQRSAIMAGASINTVPDFEASPIVQAEITRIRKEAVANTGITKEEVVAMFMEAANFARILGDSMGLIAAAREIGKMLGHYAPEVKKTLHDVDAASLRKALKDMNDEDLYKLANAKVIDGTATRVEESVPKMLEVRTRDVVLPQE